jgi:hypothetical protein
MLDYFRDSPKLIAGFFFQFWYLKRLKNVIFIKDKWNLLFIFCFQKFWESNSKVINFLFFEFLSFEEGWLFFNIFILISSQKKSLFFWQQLHDLLSVWFHYLGFISIKLFEKCEYFWFVTPVLLFENSFNFQRSVFVTEKVVFKAIIRSCRYLHEFLNLKILLSYSYSSRAFSMIA